MYRIRPIGFKRPISFCIALVSFAVAAGYVCESRQIPNGVSLLSLDQETLCMLFSQPSNSSSDVRMTEPAIYRRDEPAPDNPA